MRAFISVLMLTTIGVWAFAMLRKVCASSAPVSGAEFIVGRAIDWAADCGARSSREARTIPTAIDATAMSRA